MLPSDLTDRRSELGTAVSELTWLSEVPMELPTEGLLEFVLPLRETLAEDRPEDSEPSTEPDY